jgi:PD-(D/E)XK nuclease superfamily protein
MEDSTYKTGIRPIIDKLLMSREEAYPDYFRVSSAGYCYRHNIMKRLGVPPVPGQENDVRTIKVFTAGHIFHEWMQRLTKEAGISVSQEDEVRDPEYELVGHYDDLVRIDEGKLILYDYKTQNSRAFTWQKGKPISTFHKYQLGTYMWQLRNQYPELDEARILKISKDDMRMHEEILYWNDELEDQILHYWDHLKEYWEDYKATGDLPKCICLKIDDGWFGKTTKAGKSYNPYMYAGEPCSQLYFDKWLETKEKTM